MTFTSTEKAILQRYITDEKGSQGTIAEAIGVNQSTISRAMANLERKGYLSFDGAYTLKGHPKEVIQRILEELYLEVAAWEAFA